MKLPKVSFIVCSFNSPEFNLKCIKSILKQKYSGKIEILIIDGGSDKRTINALKRYPSSEFIKIKIIHNKERLPEGYGKGKWLGWKKATGDFVIILDEDNELQEKNWLEEIVKILLKEKDIFGCACKLNYKEKENFMNRYIALQGTDPFMAYKSLDGIINLKKNVGERKKEYLIYKFNKKNVLITGGNCFAYRKKYLDDVGGYTKDTDNICKLVYLGRDEIAIPLNISTHHNAVTGFFNFIRKKKKWGENYFLDNKEKNNLYVSTNAERREFILNFFFIITFLPNMINSYRLFLNTRKKEAFLLPLLNFITGFIYFYSAIKVRIFLKFYRQKLHY